MMLDHYDFPIIDKYEVGTQGREQGGDGWNGKGDLYSFEDDDR